MWLNLYELTSLTVWIKTPLATLPSAFGLRPPSVAQHIWASIAHYLNQNDDAIFFIRAFICSKWPFFSVHQQFSSPLMHMHLLLEFFKKREAPSSSHSLSTPQKCLWGRVEGRGRGNKAEKKISGQSIKISLPPPPPTRKEDRERCINSQHGSRGEKNAYLGIKWVPPIRIRDFEHLCNKFDPPMSVTNWKEHPMQVFGTIGLLAWKVATSTCKIWEGSVQRCGRVSRTHEHTSTQAHTHFRF